MSSQNEADENVVHANITSVHVHPDWDPEAIKFDADLAILVLSHNITFTNFIRPVCIPGDSVLHTESGVMDTEGTVVGWGLTDNGTQADVPRQASVQALNDSFCYQSDPAMASYSSNRTFCGGFGDGSPQFGDSGTGFYVLSDNVWVQYGIVSAMRTNRTGFVIRNSMAVYSNVKAFKPWIVETVQQTDGEVGESMMTIKLNCTFGFNEESHYECWLKDLDVRRENVFVNGIGGSHFHGKSNDDIEYLQLDSGSMTYVPNGIGRIFRNLNTLKIAPKLGARVIRRSHFRNMKNLGELDIFENDIETLDADLFWDLPNLEVFHLEGNKITELHGSTFEKNEKLKYIVLKLNLRLEVLPEILFQNNLLLEEVTLPRNNLRAIPEQMFETISKLKMVDLALNMLEHLPKDLFKNNVHLEFVDVGGNFLQTLDDTIFETCTKLTNVYLHSNRLQFLPGNLFKNNLFLETILLSDNRWRSIAENLFEHNAQLHIVLLASALLTDLPLNLFVNNSRLELVDVSENSIRTIAAPIFENNVQLLHINLSTNMLENLPSQLFERNLLLTRIDVSHNSIKHLDEQIFATNSQLEMIALSSNQLQSLPGKIFILCYVMLYNLLLSTIELGRNSLATLDVEIFETNLRLERIFLNNNRLESLSSKLFSKNLLLKIVDFSDNSLVSIEFDFTKLNHIRLISFQNNVCIKRTFDMPYLHTESLRNLMEFQNVLRQNCSSPSRLR
ncbi:protein artichoke-like [Bradysia coprophila]|uniref:protein artichoke-like n=1 Tax=Bradysia coprophila TaxID=38358 RepID=UPI00187D8878|nr:protein artichoke-like [Bradysia coprophila]